MIRKNLRLPKKRRATLSRFIWPITAVLLALVVVGVLEWRGTINLLHSSKTNATIPSQSSPETSSPTKDAKSSAPESTSPAPPSPKQDPQPTPQTGEAPAAPYGDFVSNHHPNLGGKPAPSNMVSVCNTTPGATCYIAFTKDGVVKKLDPQTTDGNGAAYWRWDVKDADLTSGTWEVKAVANLNNKTVSVTDAQKLEVQQ